MNTITPAGGRALVALDIDGTLCPDKTTDIPAITRRAVTDVVAAGHDVVLATGRSLVGAMDIAAVLRLHRSWIVASNGAVTARLDERWPLGYRVETCRTFDVEPVARLALRLCPDVCIAVEEIGWGYDVSRRFTPGQLNGRQT